MATTRNGGRREIAPGVLDREANAARRAIERWENEGGNIPAVNRTSTDSVVRSEARSDEVVDGCRVIEIHLRQLSQLFDSLDPSPFREKDLDAAAEEYIVGSIKELPSRAPCELVICLDQPASVPNEGNVIGAAIQAHFARRAQALRRDLRQLLRRGSISLGIGLGFLVAFFLLGQFILRVMGESQWGTLLRESLIIGGWVAMWKPLEIFLYDWWPLVGERRIHDRLSRITVRAIYASRPTSAGLQADKRPPLR